MPRTWIWVGRNVSEAITEWDAAFEEEGVVFRDRVRPGDRILWWKSGRGSGIYGDGQVVGAPVSAGYSGWHKREYRFKVRVSSRYPEAPLLREVLLTDPVLRPLVKRLQQQRPNPRDVSSEEWRALRRHLAAPRFQTAVVQLAGAGFGQATTNREVEKAAVRFVSNRYRNAGWAVQSVEASRCGYDLLCIKQEEVLHIEVKGSSGNGSSFIITAGELSAARVDPLIQLAVVSNALQSPRLSEFTGKQALRRFDTLPISYMCRQKRSVAG